MASAMYAGGFVRSARGGDAVNRSIADEDIEDSQSRMSRELETARTKLKRLREVVLTLANYSDAAAHAARLAENSPSDVGRDAAYTDMTNKIRNALSRTDVCP